MSLAPGTRIGSDEVAGRLEAAHEQVIIHRDLKPANIKVRADGTVRVLDIGLAKTLDPAAYMNPEQAKGRLVDRHADVWASGAVLFEMLTGTRAFVGEGSTRSRATAGS